MRNEAELELALGAGATIVAVNSRDLETLEIDPNVHERLLPKIPSDRTLAVASGGIKSLGDIEKMAKFGAKAVRVASVLMEAKDPYDALHTLLGTIPPEDEPEPA